MTPFAGVRQCVARDQIPNSGSSVSLESQTPDLRRHLPLSLAFH